MERYVVHLVEDEKNLAAILKKYMERQQWDVTVFTAAEEAEKHINDSVHLWVLDIMLPGMSGYELLNQIKARSRALVIFISARDEDCDKIYGLEAGGDDYLAKPFLPRELVIRAEKLLRRVYEKPNIRVCGYDIDLRRRKVSRRETPIELTGKEFDLLLSLLEHPNEILSRSDILKAVWGSDYVGSERAVDEVVHRLRQKLPKLDLETCYGAGYRVVVS